LHLLGDLQLLGGTTLPLKPLGLGPPAFFNRSGYIVEARQDERVTVHIFKTRKLAAPCRSLRRNGKFHPAL